MSNSMIEKVNALIAAPTCCAELRAVAEEWLKAVGTEGEKEASAKLIAELEEDVCTCCPLFWCGRCEGKSRCRKTGKSRRRYLLPVPRMPGRRFHPGGEGISALRYDDNKRSGRLTGPFFYSSIYCIRSRILAS